MDPASAEELARLRPRLLRFASRRLSCRAQAEDAVQEALLAALEGLDRFAGQSSLSTWACAILRYKIADRLRTLMREEPLEADYALPDMEDPVDTVQRRRVLEALERGLARLPTKTRRVFLLREVLGMESGEICSALEMTVTDFGVTLHRARRRLRDHPELQEFAADAI